MRKHLEFIIIHLLAGLLIYFSLGLLFEVKINTNRVIWYILTLLLAYTIIKRKD